MWPLHLWFQPQDSETRAARTVRQLLAKHQENVKQASVTPSVQQNILRPSSLKFNQQNSGANFTQTTGTENSNNECSITPKHSPEINGRVVSPISSSSVSYLNRVS